MSDEDLRRAVTHTLAAGKAVELVCHVLSESTLTTQECNSVETALETARIRGQVRAIRKHWAAKAFKEAVVAEERAGSGPGLAHVACEKCGVKVRLPADSAVGSTCPLRDTVHGGSTYYLREERPFP